jgi:hypothetical protein
VANSGNRPVDIAKQLDEANRSFTYRGQPINPRAVNELHEWMADGVAGPTAISLLGTYDSNRYYGQNKTGSDGSVSFDSKPKGYFGYRGLGALKDNLHVLEVWETGAERACLCFCF